MNILLQHILNGLLVASKTGLVALGFWLIWRVRKFFHIGHAAVVSAGAYSSLALLLQGFSFAVSVAIGMLCAAALGVIFEYALFMRIERADSTNLVLFIVSLGVLVATVAVIAATFGPDVATLSRWPVKEGWHILGARVTPVQVIIISSAICTYLATWLLLRLSNLGIRIAAVANDALLARVIGVDIPGVYLWVAGIASLLAGAAGIIIGCDSGIEPTMGLQPLFYGIVAVIIGGNSLLGTSLGVLIVALTQTVTVVFLPLRWQDAIVFSLLIVFLIVRPRRFWATR